ncbi:hypothetical protein ABZ820_12725 [Streptomyces diacarni]|uniref:hypothetical protein n=1 Tax=Streptomyces diacarni TaxID=2800381 RepID=UPI0033D202BB
MTDGTTSERVAELHREAARDYANGATQRSGGNEAELRARASESAASVRRARS